MKYDVENDQVIRDKKTGLCIACQPGEVGELVGRIDEDPLRQFAGYTDKKASERKILTNVFEKGDQYFRTGDLLRIDKVICSFFFFECLKFETNKKKKRVDSSISSIVLETLFGGREKTSQLLKWNTSAAEFLASKK